MAHVSWVEALAVLVPILIVLAIGALIAVVVGFGILRSVLRYRRVMATVAAATPSPVPVVELWGRGAWGVWSGLEDSAAWPAERARSSLASWYGATDGATLSATIEGLRRGQTGNPSWDQVRALDLLRIGVAAGYLTPDACFAQVRAIAVDLQRTYDSWEALAAAFEQGMNAWQASRGITDPAEVGRVQRNLPLLRAHVWPTVAFGARC